MKKHSFLIIALVLLTSSLSAQNNKAAVSLTAAIYEEEVSGNLDKAVELYLNILKKYPNDPIFLLLLILAGFFCKNVLQDPNCFLGICPRGECNLFAIRTN